MIMPDTAMPSSIEGTETVGSLMRGQSPQFEMHQSDADDTCVIIYTSSTTGRPKGAELSHANLLLNALFFCELIEFKPGDTALLVLPLFHIFGMTALMNAGVYRGCT